MLIKNDSEDIKWEKIKLYPKIKKKKNYEAFIYSGQI